MVDISIAELPARADQHDFNTPMRRKMRKMLDIVGWAVVLLLLFVGLSSLVTRVVLLNSEFSKEVVNIGNGSVILISGIFSTISLQGFTCYLDLSSMSSRLFSS
jgi:hypothetical protein